MNLCPDCGSEGTGTPLEYQCGSRFLVNVPQPRMERSEWCLFASRLRWRADCYRDALRRISDAMGDGYAGDVARAALEEYDEA